MSCNFRSLFRHHTVFTLFGIISKVDGIGDIINANYDKYKTVINIVSSCNDICDDSADVIVMSLLLIGTSKDDFSIIRQVPAFSEQSHVVDCVEHIVTSLKERDNKLYYAQFIEQDIVDELITMNESIEALNTIVNSTLPGASGIVKNYGVQVYERVHGFG